MATKKTNERRIDKVITMEDIPGSAIRFKNFSGEEGQYNQKGKRNFCVLLDDDLAHQMEDDGWNVKWLRPREEEDAPQAYIQVSVAFEPIPCKVVLVTSRGKTLLTEETVNILDFAEIVKVDLAMRPYNWTVNGRSGVKCYVKTMFVTIQEDEFEDKYYDVPDSAISSIG